ncbi:MAG: hypothetical protein HC888_01760 [Candidatus Competibacteraceae bacterium]|nr:hypothetical protein [Candidatus Competibacteraceae bacterium]
MTEAIDNMLQDLDNIAIIGYNEDKAELSAALYDVYYIAFQNHSVATRAMSQAVTALQQHLISGAGSVNAFLSSNSIKVSGEFADLSRRVGYLIDVSNVEA